MSIHQCQIYLQRLCESDMYCNMVTISWVNELSFMINSSNLRTSSHLLPACVRYSTFYQLWFMGNVSQCPLHHLCPWQLLIDCVSIMTVIGATPRARAPIARCRSPGVATNRYVAFISGHQISCILIKSSAAASFWVGLWWAILNCNRHLWQLYH